MLADIPDQGITAMTPPEIVTDRFPHAVAKYHDVVQRERAAPKEKAHWAIHTGPGLGERVIGRGATEEAAWNDAARRIQKGEIDKRLD